MREKSAKKRSAVLTYEQVVKIPIGIGIPIRVIKIEKPAGLQVSAVGLFLHNLSKRIAKITAVLILIFGLFLQIIPLVAFEAHIINVTAKVCNYSQTRSMDYWQNHPEVYDPALLPQTLGGIGSEDLSIDNQTEVNKVFDDYNLSMHNELRGQDLAMKFNIAKFGIGGFEYFVGGLGTTTMDNLVVYADGLLNTNPAPPDSLLENIKDALDTINGLKHIKLCGTGGQGGPENPKIVINKVYYNVDSKHGTDPANEWIELYNSGTEPVNIRDWTIEDNSSSDLITSSSPIIIPSLGFAIITGTSTTWNYWNIPDNVLRIVLADGKIGDGLDNESDMLVLKDTEGNIVDQMNWGIPDSSWPNYNLQVWFPGVAYAPEGDMLARYPNGFDTDQVTDWIHFAPPTLTILNPVGGETWYVGHTYNLEWTATNPNGLDNELSIDIYYSGDSGATWGQIIKGTENDGSYSWYVGLFLEPGHYYVPSPHARIKIVATGPENFMVQGEVSSRDFCPPIDYDSLSSGDQQLVDQMISQGLIDESEVIRGGVDPLTSSGQEPTQEIVQEAPQENISTSTEIATSSDENIIEAPTPDLGGGGQQIEQPAQVSEATSTPEGPTVTPPETEQVPETSSEPQASQITGDQPAVEQQPVIAPENNPSPDSAPPDASGSGSSDGSAGPGPDNSIQTTVDSPSL